MAVSATAAVAELYRLAVVRRVVGVDEEGAEPRFPLLVQPLRMVGVRVQNAKTKDLHQTVDVVARVDVIRAGIASTVNCVAVVGGREGDVAVCFLTNGLAVANLRRG